MFRGACLLPCVVARSSSQTGVSVPALAPFEQLVSRLMSNYRIPGGSLAVTRNGRLIFARGYGYADRDTGEPVLPDSRLRIASVSKFVTSVAIMRLVELRKLDSDQPAFDLLPGLQPPAGEKEDSRLNSVTIRRLLTHSGGWDDTSTFDLLFSAPMIASSLGVPSRRPPKAFL